MEAEAEAFLATMREIRLPDGRERLVRHSHGPECLVRTGISPVAVQRLKLRDRGASAGSADDAGAGRIRFTSAIRAHWKIENTSHYTCDVTLGEDRSRIRANPGVFARLRIFAFNILNAKRTDTLSQDHYWAGFAGITKLLRMLAVS